MRHANLVGSVVALSLALVGPSAADVITVCPGGSCDYENIQDAIDAAADGDEIVVYPGEYDETINFNCKAVVLRSLNGPDVTKIDGSDLADSVVKCIGTDEVEYPSLIGFTITGGVGTPGPDFGGGVQLVGGGMYNESCSPEVIDCKFIDNDAESGAGMFNYNSDPIVLDCRFEDNTATPPAAPHAGGGAGMYNYLSDPYVVNCVFQGNSVPTQDGGAGMYIDTSSPWVVNCLFSGNYCWNNAGGMYVYGSSAPKVINCTFSYNWVGDLGGGILLSGDSAQAEIKNCIFWENTDSGGTDESAQINVYSGTVEVGFTCIQGLDTFDGNGNIGDDPLFRDLIGPDGVPGTGDEDFRLQCDSPCIDAGDTAMPLDLGLYVDLDGKGRMIDKKSTADTGIPAGIVPVTVDMGAYEWYWPVGDINFDCQVNFFDIGPFVELITQ